MTIKVNLRCNGFTTELLFIKMMSISLINVSPYIFLLIENKKSIVSKVIDTIKKRI